MMLETVQTSYIPFDSIVLPHPEETFSSLEDIATHVKKREGYFISRLAAVAFGTKTGWQKIERNNGIITKKLTNSKDPKGTFTGKNLCDLAAIALASGLQKKTIGMNISVVALAAEMNMEPEAEQAEKLSTHFLVEVEDDMTKGVLYFDPTYPQIDHRTQWTISVFSKEELSEKYSKRSHPITLEKLTAEDIDDIKIDLSIFYFSGNDFQQLQQTVL